jgi:RNA polymerase sigma factor (sigma-70 family)
MQLGDHFFRREAGRLVAALTHLFGVHNLALAEDVVQDAFCRALEVWPFRGVPENPSAWLMTTAKRRAIDVLRRERTARTFAPEYGRLLQREWAMVPLVDERVGAALDDDLLRMMFSCCHPRISEEAQVALVLHVLCGFSVNEVAAAFLGSPAATQKRIVRAKRVLAASRRIFDLADRDFTVRLSAVHRALYLLFNEGYHGSSAESAVRVELCQEASRLALLLAQHPLTSTPATLALTALMYLHSARLPARVDEAGNLSSLLDQDRSRWDRRLIAKGMQLLDRSATGVNVTEYHIEAAIASIHASARSMETTDWGHIVSLYDMLMALRPSPVVALNRAIAIGQYEGAERGLDAIHAIDDRDRLTRYPFYFAALADLELRRERRDTARFHFRTALALARSPAERTFLQCRIAACDAQDTALAGKTDGSAETV